MDTDNTPARFREIARMCDRAGVDALWVADSDAGHRDGSGLEAWTAAVLIALDTSRVQVGAMLQTRRRPAELLAPMVRTLCAVAGGRVSIGCCAGGDGDGARSARDDAGYATRLRELGVDAPICLAARSPEGFEHAVRAGDDVLLRVAAAGLAEAIDGVRAACEAIGRDPDTVGVAVERPVSVGRTRTEAHARAGVDDGFRKAAADSGAAIVGTLEECQDRVIELAHLGVTELRCRVPNTPDVHDAIAQLTAMAVGSLGALEPSAPRSAAPAPPEGWGGRSLRA